MNARWRVDGDRGAAGAGSRAAVGQRASGGVGEGRAAADPARWWCRVPTVTGPAVGTPGSTVTVTVSGGGAYPVVGGDGEGVGGGGVGDGLALQVGGCR